MPCQHREIWTKRLPGTDLTIPEHFFFSIWKIFLTHNLSNEIMREIHLNLFFGMRKVKAPFWIETTFTQDWEFCTTGKVYPCGFETVKWCLVFVAVSISICGLACLTLYIKHTENLNLFRDDWNHLLYSKISHAMYHTVKYILFTLLVVYVWRQIYVCCNTMNGQLNIYMI